VYWIGIDGYPRGMYRENEGRGREGCNIRSIDKGIQEGENKTTKLTKNARISQR